MRLCAVLVSLVLKVSPLIVNIYPSIASSILHYCLLRIALTFFLCFLVSRMYLRPKWSVIAGVCTCLFLSKKFESSLKNSRYIVPRYASLDLKNLEF